MNEMVLDSVTRRPRGGRPRGTGSPALLGCLAAVAVLVMTAQAFSDVRWPARPSFVPAMLALVGCLDLLSAVLLVRQFRDTGEMRALALGWAYVFSLVILAGYGAAFPGVLGDIGPLGGRASNAPWLWVVWHTAFPILLAASTSRWPRRFEQPFPPQVRSLWLRATVAGWVVAGVAVVAAVVEFGGHLPVIIHGLDTTAMTRWAGPVMLPVVVAATVIAVRGATRMTGPQRWAALAAAAALGDVVLTLFSRYRFSLGWYVGRSLTVVSCGVVLIAMLVEFSRLKRQLAEEADRLRAALHRGGELERLQEILLDHMADGVMMQSSNGRVLASNPAVESLLSLTTAQLAATAPPPGWALVHRDGTPAGWDNLPSARTLRTGEPATDEIVGVDAPDAARRWLRMTTAVTLGPDGGIDYVVTSMTDVTEAHNARLEAMRELTEYRERIGVVLDSGGPTMVVQPIADLVTGVVVGGEALARFSVTPQWTPDVWFATAAELGIGVELELAAVRAAIGMGESFAEGVYLSVNVSPMTAVSPGLAELLADCQRPVLLELTEHADVDDYPRLLTALATLRARGVRLAVDDAGSGFASLRHILNLRPDVIKLDLALVRGIDADPARRALAAGLLTFSRQIGAELVAEGIETEDELRTLRDIGIARGQGFLLGRPTAAPLPDTIEIPVAEEHLSA